MKASLIKQLLYPFYILLGFKNLRRIMYYYRLLYKYRGRLIFSFSTDINKNSSFEGCNKIYPRSKFAGSMGYGSYISSDSQVKAHIGRFTSIAPFVRVNVGTHPFKVPYVTTSPMFFSTHQQSGDTFANRTLYEEVMQLPVIGNDVWICENVFISGGVTIGDGAVILPGSVVSKDVPPYAIVGGVPAKTISYRYDEKTINYLLEVKWWNLDVKWLKENWELLCDIDSFKSMQRH